MLYSVILPVVGFDSAPWQIVFCDNHLGAAAFGPRERLEVIRPGRPGAQIVSGQEIGLPLTSLV